MKKGLIATQSAAGQARFSLFALKQRFTVDVFQAQLARLERQWQAKLEQYKAAA